MVDFKKIKLIIWDLDETLWSGTLSDNDLLVVNSQFVDLINDSLDRGIVHSICSKNDFEEAKEKLASLGLWNMFVFPSINWNPKGERIKNIISNMNLRAENVLFVDDNISNLREAVYYCSDMQICTPQELLASVGAVYEIEKIDKTRPRLAQYQLLEQKAKSQQEFSSNEEFLMSCNIRVDTHDNCVENVDRIHDLILRSNQLNYTKFRQEKEALLADLSLPDTQAAYVTVTDSFGDYGIVGFYMIVNGEVKHFLFSCRTLGMLVEQYIYMQIGCPPITVIGDVITELNSRDLPRWINCENSLEPNLKNKHTTGNQKILFKGPCDISQIFSFIEETEDIITEFTYTNDNGISVEGYNHSSQIATALTASAKEKTMLVQDTPWLDEKMLDASCWCKSDAIVFSLLPDGNLGIYKHKQTGWQISLCEKYYDLTDPKNRQDYINKRIFTSNIDFTEKDLVSFAERYEFLNNDNGEITLNNLDTLYAAKKSDAKLILLLGSEKAHAGTNPAYQDRHIFHKILNDKVKLWAENKRDVYLIEISKYITSEKDYLDTINHFQKKVYYHMAQDILGILSSEKSDFKIKKKTYLYWSSANTKARALWAKLRNFKF